LTGATRLSERAQHTRQIVNKEIGGPANDREIKELIFMKRYIGILLAVFVGSAGFYAHSGAEAQQPNHVPIYRVEVVARTIKAINYRHRSGETKVDFLATSLMSEASGDAHVQSKEGVIEVAARFRHMQPANRFGAEYMTYVLWAISPEGRPVNLGEVLPDRNGNASLDVTSNLQAFGMVVTAEPHFAVTQPSDVVVMENLVTHETNGTVEEVDAKFELLRRGQYTASVNPAELTPMEVDGKAPIEIYEARNAIRIAKWAGAETYAGDTLSKAELDLQNAESLYVSGGDRKDSITDAREAAQMAEDARLITIRKIITEEQAQARENAAAAEVQAAQAQAQAQADAEAAARAKQQTEQAQQAQAQADAAEQAAEAQAQQAQLQAAQAERDKAALRARLQQELSTVLQTRDSARGLIMNMSDVLFEFGQYTLKPEAREKLAKVSGILLSFPGLTLEVDGYTDNVGSDEFNQKLSEERAGAVRDYLTSQGVSAGSITTKGFGKVNPIASNDTPEGRKENRRVELVVSGDSIRAQMNAPATGAE
jgi:outer membrane protein OmpA-like peptidoglycan-associated protein